jgi:hypothetical protein
MMPNDDLPGGFKETEIGPIPVEWEVARLAQAETNVELNAVLTRLGSEG